MSVKSVESEHSTLIGILFMMLNAFSIAMIYGISKELTQELHSNLVVFLYKFSILIIILPWCFKGGFGSMKTKRLGLHASRGFLSVCGSLSLYYAIKHIELVDITAIGYLEQVVLVIVGIFYFKEQATFAKVAGIMASFIGAILVVNPKLLSFSGDVPVFSGAQVNPYYAFVMMSIAFWATNCTVIKVLGKTESTKVQLFYVLLFSSMIAFPMGFMHWERIINFGVVELKYPYAFKTLEELGLRFEHIKYLVILAIFYFAHSVSFFQALRYAELSTVIPFDYSRLIFAGIIGYLMFGETPASGAYFGYIMIIGAGIYLIKAENKRRRKRLSETKVRQLESEYEHA
jgi:drug/metabolite transporter (DMT)-like permease